jgi:DNA-binding GntR family transcriptional regulator
MKTETIAQSVQGRLRSDILFGRLVPDDRLRLERLCDTYEVGMSPMREALAQLVGTGLVVQEGQRGFRVASVSHEELVDITATRVRLETMALRDAIEKGDDDWEAGILAAHHRLARCPRTADRLVDETWEQLHRKFHLALIEACGSPCMLVFCHTLYDQFDRYRRLAVVASGKHPRISPVHGDIVTAVIARNAARASALLEGHIKEAAAEVMRMSAARFAPARARVGAAGGTSLAKSASMKAPMRRGDHRDALRRQAARKGTRR